MQVLQRVEFVSRVPDRFHVQYDYYTDEDFNGRSGWQRIQLPGVLLGAVGGPMILFDQYDPDQGWFPFVQAVFSHAPPVPKDAWQIERDEWDLRMRLYGDSRDRQHNREQIRRGLEAKFFVRDDDRKMYHYPRNQYSEANYQRVLPFHEFRDAKGYEYGHAQFTWDKHPVPADAKPDRYGDLPEPEPLSFRANGSRGRVTEWCAETCAGRYHVGDDGTVTFERHAEWVHAKLRFQGGVET